MSPKSYDGFAIRVRFDPRRCIHAAECARGLPAVFDPEKRPWIDPDGAPADDVANVIHRCPSGALTYERLDGGPSEPEPDENTVTLSPDGPVYVRGRLQVSSASGEELFTGTRVALCRCGASANKPFCDGAHTDAGFADPGATGTLPGATAEAADGPLEISVASNGPLILKGAYRVVPAGTEPTGPLAKGALCRCGQSENRPFCDGTHTRVGFEAG